MKNRLFSACAFIAINLFCAASLRAQSYIDIQAGYGCGAPNDGLNDFYNIEWTNTTSTIEHANIYFGKGFTFTGAYGFRVNDVLSASIQASYLLGTNNTITYTYSEPGNPDVFKEVLKYSSRMVRLNPSIECTIKPGKISPFMDFGFLFSYGKIIQNYQEDSYGTLIHGISKYSGGLGFGITAGLGCSYELSDRFSLFGRLRSESMSYSPLHGEVTKYESDGEDLLSTLSVHDREIEFVNELESDLSATEDENKPDRQMKSHYPFSTIQFNVGVRIKL